MQRRNAIFAALTVLWVALLVELAGAGLAAIEHHRIIYFAAEKKPHDVQTQQNVLIQVHPYFGFIYAPTSDRPDVDNAIYRDGFNFAPEFTSRHPEYTSYPTPRTNNNVLLVGVFGGSLANALAFHDQRSGWLSDSLKKIPAYRDREPIVLNFAIPGHRQPQQNQVLAMMAALGQPLDIVINIDGFNEKNMFWPRDKLDPSFPPVSAWKTLRDLLDHPESVEGTSDRVKRLYHQVAIEAAFPEECRFGLCYAAARLMQAYHRLMLHEPGPAPLSHFAWPSPPNKDPFDNAVDIWTAASLTMAHIAKAMGATYLHVLHPNQWYRKRDDFVPKDPQWASTREELKIVYPRLIKAGNERLASHLNFLDATGIFDDRLDVYEDDCCHLSGTGFRLLSEAIGNELGRISDRPVSH